MEFDPCAKCVCSKDQHPNDPGLRYMYTRPRQMLQQSSLTHARVAICIVSSRESCEQVYSFVLTPDTTYESCPHRPQRPRHLYEGGCDRDMVAPLKGLGSHERLILRESHKTLRDRSFAQHRPLQSSVFTALYIN